MQRPTILLVDDENYGLRLLADILSDFDCDLAFAKNGERALELVEKNPPNLILLDIVMPGMDGWEVLSRLKQNINYRDIPVIVQTGLQSSENFERGLAAGAYYFINKPLDPERVRPLVHAALEEYKRVLQLKEELKNIDSVISSTTQWQVKFRTLDDAYSLSKMIAKACPEPDRVLTGLLELLINAVEHGIARISYDEKTELLYHQKWEEELARRLSDPANQELHALLTLTKTKESVRIDIEDPGPGFDWSNYLEFSIERATDSHGRGIAMAKALSFDHLEYKGKGNLVSASLTALSQ